MDLIVIMILTSRTRISFIALVPASCFGLGQDVAVATLGFLGGEDILYSEEDIEEVEDVEEVEIDDTEEKKENDDE